MGVTGENEIRTALGDRIWYVGDAFRVGMTVAEVHELAVGDELFKIGQGAWRAVEIRKDGVVDRQRQVSAEMHDLDGTGVALGQRFSCRELFEQFLGPGPLARLDPELPPCRKAEGDQQQDER